MVLYSLMMIYSLLMKILVMPRCLVMKWVFIEISADLNNISLDEINFDKHDPETIIHVILMAWCSRYKQCKACKRKIQATN